MVIGLGCETNQIDDLLNSQNLSSSSSLRTMTIQGSGGTAKSVASGIDQIRQMLPSADAVTRTPADASHLTVGLQCGGSDGYSGISANPALGAAVDLLVAHGGTAILSETPEIYGAEHLLTRRAVSRAVGEKLIGRVHWWETYCERMSVSMNNNPSAGKTKLEDSLRYWKSHLGQWLKAVRPTLWMFIAMQSRCAHMASCSWTLPGYDPISVTGCVACGANLICFTTGRGSAYGCAPSPSLKFSTNTALWQKRSDYIDLNCGSILDGTRTIEEIGNEIFELMLSTASGTRTKSEIHGYGQNEFVPWQIGAIL